MQHLIVALVSGKKKNGWVAHVGIADLIPKCLRLILRPSDHSVLMIPKLWRDPPEQRSFILRLTGGQPGRRYVD